MKIRRKILAAAAMLVATSMTTSAQQAALPPVLRDIPEKQTLPPDIAFDLVGVRLGATRPEIIKQIEKAMPDTEVSGERHIMEIADNRGNAVRFLYTPRVSAAKISRDRSDESIEAYFTTGINGERAVHISRKVGFTPERQGSIPDLMADLNAKFGPPSNVSIPRHAGGVRVIYYIWFNGKRLTLTAQDIEKQMDIPNSQASCRFANASGYTFDSSRRIQYPACTTLIKIEAHVGRREDLMSQVTFTLMDRTRLIENIKDTDAYILRELDKVVKGQSGTRTKL